jgi:ArsR family transcriptional regulator, arsenate/arsenite/antimonite-responsive transcriptional repressor
MSNTINETLNPVEPANTNEVAAMLKALGEPTRLRIFQFLRSCCCPVAVDEETGDVRPVLQALSGPTVGEVCCHVTGQERVTSTISEHLKDLRVAGVILMERRGKNVVCAVNPVALAHLSAFFTLEDKAIGQPDAKGSMNNERCC